MEIEATAFSFEDRLKQQTFDENQPRKINEPSQTELCETVILLKQIMPHRSIERAIIMLYETLVKRRTPQEIYESLVAEPGSEKSSNVPNAQQQNSKSLEKEVSKIYQKDDLLRKSFSSQADQNKYKDKRLVAKSFVAKGYGHHYALDEFSKAKFEPADKSNLSFTKEVYKKTIGAVITQAFRKLESFLTEDCKKKLNPLSKDDLGKLMKHLLSNSTLENISVFKKYIRLLYGLSNVTLIEGQSTKLYLEALKHLKDGKIVTLEEVEANSVQEKPEGSQTNSQNLDVKQYEGPKISQNIDQRQQTIHPKIEQSFVVPDEVQTAKLYIQYQSLSKCFAHLSHRFQNMSKLRLHFFSTLRTILKSLQNSNKGQQHFKLQSLNEKLIESIFNSKRGMSIRLNLLECLIHPGSEREHQAIQAINDFIANQNEKESIKSSLQDCNELTHDFPQKLQEPDEVKQEEDSSRYGSFQ